MYTHVLIYNRNMYSKRAVGTPFFADPGKGCRGGVHAERLRGGSGCARGRGQEHCIIINII